ncbi:MAG TPA: hypothetical protein VKV25_08360 [Acidimicrobiales bacterium]|nr:hypothetical protein [Acidimicrobiales bacterium]
MAADLRARYLKYLMGGVGEERFPSPMMLNRIEAAVADRRTAEAYVGMLIDTLEGERYPSPVLLDRVRRLLDALDVTY